MAKNEPRKERLRFLKRLSNRHLRTGTIVHLIIRTYFKHMQRGDEWTSERAIGWARQIYRADLEFSRGYERGDPLSDDLTAPVLLMEFYFGLPNAEALWAESEARLVKGLTNFFASSKIEPFRLGGHSPDALVEKSLGIKQERFSVTGKLDLTFTEDDRIVVVDWKTGGAGGGDDGLQLYTYAISASRHLGRDLEDVDLYQVGLGEDEVSHFVMGARDSARAKARILQDLETMNTLHSYGQDGVPEAFTPCVDRVFALSVRTKSFVLRRNSNDRGQH